MSFLLYLPWGGTRIVLSTNFDHNCGSYIKKAVNSETVELAIKNLEVAVKYAEDNNLTSGYTSVMYNTPDEDIGLWYENLVESLEKLKAVTEETSQPEKDNILMELRKILLDGGQETNVTAPFGASIYPVNTFYAFWGLDEGQTSVTVPLGISIYPMNTFYALWGWFSFLSPLFLISYLDDYEYH